jgi:hypothetical protein
MEEQRKHLNTRNVEIGEAESLATVVEQFASSDAPLSSPQNTSATQDPVPGAKTYDRPELKDRVESVKAELHLPEADNKGVVARNRQRQSGKWIPRNVSEVDEDILFTDATGGEAEAPFPRCTTLMVCYFLIMISS